MVPTKSAGSEINPAKTITAAANAGPLHIGAKREYWSGSVSARANSSISF
jgi:hypothetical protein